MPCASAFVCLKTHTRIPAPMCTSHCTAHGTPPPTSHNAVTKPANAKRKSKKPPRWGRCMAVPPQQTRDGEGERLELHGATRPPPFPLPAASLPSPHPRVCTPSGKCVSGIAATTRGARMASSYLLQGTRAGGELQHLRGARRLWCKRALTHALARTYVHMHLSTSFRFCWVPRLLYSLHDNHTGMRLSRHHEDGQASSLLPPLAPLWESSSPLRFHVSPGLSRSLSPSLFPCECVGRARRGTRCSACGSHPWRPGRRLSWRLRAAATRRWRWHVGTQPTPPAPRSPRRCRATPRRGGGDLQKRHAPALITSHGCEAS